MNSLANLYNNPLNPKSLFSSMYINQQILSKFNTKSSSTTAKRLTCYGMRLLYNLDTHTVNRSTSAFYPCVDADAGDEMYGSDSTNPFKKSASR